MPTPLIPKRILVIRLSSLGDILHTLPAFQDLRQSFPQARIDWLVESRMSFLLSAIEGIDKVHVVDTVLIRQRPHDFGGWRELASVLGNLRSSDYDVCIDFQGLLKTAILGLVSGASLRIGYGPKMVREKPAHWLYHRSPAGTAGPAHVTSQNRLLAYEAGAEPANNPVIIRSTPGDEDFILSRLKASQIESYIVINPGGGWPTKRWPPARYGILASRIIRDLSIPVVVTTGPGEGALFDEMAEQCCDSRLCHFAVDFLKLIPLYRRAYAVIGGDTGPFHLACALNVPVVGIFGATTPDRNGPWSNMDESVYRVLPCSFCFQRKCPTRIECLDIPVDEVFEALMRRVERFR